MCYDGGCYVEVETHAVPVGGIFRAVGYPSGSKGVEVRLLTLFVLAFLVVGGVSFIGALAEHYLGKHNRVRGKDE